MSGSKSGEVKLLNPENSRFKGQEKVNAEIFTALQILGRKLEKTEAERDRLASRLAMLESAATLDESTGKVYLPAVIDNRGKKLLSPARASVLALSSLISSVFAVAAFAIVLLQQPDLTLNKLDALKSAYINNSGLTLSEKDIMPNDVIANLDVLDNVDDIEDVADIKDFEQVEEIISEVPDVKAVEVAAAIDEIKEDSEIAVKFEAEVNPESEIKVSEVVVDNNQLARDASLFGDLKTLEQAAFSGVPEAQHDLGVYYAEGQLVKQDYNRARYWLEKAALVGVSNASYNLAVMYQQGLGVEQNFDEAFKYYNQAVELNHPEAMYNMGIIYFSGIGTNRNEALGVEYFKRAAILGVVEAAFNLGVLYESNIIGNPDANKAKEWYNMAAIKGYKQAEEALRRIEGSIYAKNSISQVEKEKKVDNIINR